MDDLVRFLRARLDEDAERARLALQQDDPENGWGTYRDEGQHHTTITPHVGMIHEAIQAEHVVRWNPARILAEVDAKRHILADYERYAAERRRAMGGWYDREASPILKFLAVVYTDHPDYRDEWRPTI